MQIRDFGSALFQNSLRNPHFPNFSAYFEAFCGIRIPQFAFRNPQFPQLIKRRQVRNAGFRVETAAHPFDENFHAVPGGDEPGH